MSKRGRTKSAQDAAGGRESLPWPERLRPLWLFSLTAILVAAPLLPSENPAHQCIGIVLIMLWVLLLVVWSLLGALAGQVAVRVRPTDAALCLFVAWHSLSALVMARLGQPRASLNLLWLWLSVPILFWFARQVIRTPAECRAITAVMIALGVGLASHGCFQYFYQLPKMRLAYAADPEGSLRKAGVRAPPGSAERRQFEDRLRSTEPVATFTLTNSLAGFLSPWIVVALGITLSQWRNKLLRRSLVRAAGFSLLILVGCWILTKSRSAWLATFFALVWLAAFGWRTRWWRPNGPAVVALISVVATAAGFGVLTGGLDLPVLTEAGKSFSYRIQYWQSSLAMIRQYPWLGCGPGNFQQYYTAYKLPGASETIADPHNFLMEIAATAGLPAVVAFLAVLGCFAWELRATGDGPADAAQDGPVQGSIRAVYWGALCGLLMAFFPCGFLGGFMPNSALLLVGAPVAALTLVLWNTWVLEGSLSAAILVAGAMALLVNLLAAGGISFSGVAQSLWLLLAVALNLRQNRKPAHVVGRGVTLAVAASATLLGVCFYLTQYEPVLRSSSLMEEGERYWNDGSLTQAESSLLAAAAADPYDAKPWMYLAELRYVRCVAEGDKTGWAGVEEAAQQMLARNKRSSVAYDQYGDWLLAWFRKTSDRERLERALAAYRKAVELYPNHSLGRAQLAWASHLAGDTVTACREAGEALRLDAMNPHGEQKLTALNLFDPGLPAAPAPLDSGTGNAEQLMQKLRMATK